LGASIWDVARDWRGLWCLTIIYFVLAVFSAYVVKPREVPWPPAEVRA
jgi:ABC-2 type transport system permease protein